MHGSWLDHLHCLRLVALVTGRFFHQSALLVLLFVAYLTRSLLLQWQEHRGIEGERRVDPSSLQGLHKARQDKEARLVSVLKGTLTEQNFTDFKRMISASAQSQSTVHARCASAPLDCTLHHSSTVISSCSIDYASLISFKMAIPYSMQDGRAMSTARLLAARSAKLVVPATKRNRSASVCLQQHEL